MSPSKQGLFPVHLTSGPPPERKSYEVCPKGAGGGVAARIPNEHRLLSGLLLVAITWWVCGCAREEVQVLKPELVFGDRGRKPGQFPDIDGIAVDAEGNIYVADVHQVQAFDPRGKPLRSIGRPGSADGEIKNEVAGIAINSLGQIILADPGGYRLQIFTLQGKFVRAFGARGTENGRFIRPQGVCVDGENRIYTVDNGADNVQVFSPDGAFLFRFGKTGNGKGEFNEPECIAVHKDRIYVADEGNGRIQYFDLKGNYQGELGRKVIPFPSGARPDGYQEAPKDYLSSYFRGDVEGIAFDNEGTLYASDEDEGTVELLAESGTRLGSFTSSEKGGMKKVQGLAMNSQRTKLYVCDEGNMRIQVFDIPSIKRAVLRKP